MSLRNIKRTLKFFGCMKKTCESEYQIDVEARLNSTTDGCEPYLMWIETHLEERFIKILEEFPQIPINSLNISSYNEKSYSEFLKFAEKFSHSVEILTLQSIVFNQVDTFSQLIEPFKNLKSIDIRYCGINPNFKFKNYQLKSLQKISIFQTNDTALKFFVGQKTIEEVKFFGSIFDPDKFFNILKGFENLKILSIRGSSNSVLDHPDRTLKLEKLEVVDLPYKNIDTIEYLKSFRGHLKELLIFQLPYSKKGGEALRFIIEEMNLDRFCFRGTDLVVNGRKKIVTEASCTESSFHALVEMLGQFSGVNKLTVSLKDPNSNKSDDLPVISADLFDKIEDLTIYFGIYPNEFMQPTLVKFSTFLKHFRCVRKLCITATAVIVQQFLPDVISRMQKLEQLHLYAKIKNIKQIGFIKTSCPHLKKLLVDKKVKNVKKFFGSQVVVEKIYYRNASFYPCFT